MFHSNDLALPAAAAAQRGGSRAQAGGRKELWPLGGAGLLSWFFLRRHFWESSLPKQGPSQELAEHTGVGLFAPGQATASLGTTRELNVAQFSSTVSCPPGTWIQALS